MGNSNRAKFILILFMAFSSFFISARGQGIAVSAGLGRMLSIDPYLDIVKKPANQFGAAYLHFTSRADTSGFAAAFGFPTFVYGVKVLNFSRVRVKDPNYMPLLAPSRLGVSTVVYAGFERPVIRLKGGLTLNYAFMNGLGYSTHIWDRQANPENELIGSRISLYFGAGLFADYRRGSWMFRLGPEYNHLSNGALARPNKGANELSMNVSAIYLFNAVANSEQTSCATRLPDVVKGPFVDISYHLGIKTSLGEWLVDRHAHEAGNALVYNHYGLFFSQNVSAGMMYRYDRRFASGLGLDMFYEPYLGRIEVQNDARPRDIQKCSWGVSARHQVYYKRMALKMSLGYFLSRPFKHYARTDEEYGYYERVGLNYNLPILGNSCRVGYDILAYRTKAYCSEIYLNFSIPLKHRCAN